MTTALPVAVGALLVAAHYGPITLALIRDGDFGTHIQLAEQLTRGTVGVPHLLFHATVGLLILLGVDSTIAAVVITIGCRVALVAATYWFVRLYAPIDRRLAAALSVLVALAGPILPPGTERTLYMLGYFLPNALHNPTVTFAAAFVPLLLMTGIVAAGWQRPTALPHAGVITFLAGLAKPHYVSCILPATVVCAGVRAARSRPVPTRLLLRTLIIPAVLVLGWSVAGNVMLTGGGTAVVAPLVVLARYVPVDTISILQRLASDIAFPLAAIALWFRAAFRFPPFALAGLAYVVGLAQSFLLAESGPRMFEGNFIWSGQLATLGLMVAAAALLASRTAEEGAVSWRVLAGWAVLILHAGYGVMWGWSPLG